MTGKDLIIYILENNLEDCELVMDIQEAALKYNVGTSTIEALISYGKIKKSEFYWIRKENK